MLDETAGLEREVGGKGMYEDGIGKKRILFCIAGIGGVGKEEHG